ncbi:MAG TPA: LptA/OstA family protein [Candidatus Mcinerneyibacteriales bacterium]|nr:LptA/OstA family protein [Candidatus Mcinerneyibacteriales bacterium]
MGKNSLFPLVSLLLLAAGTVRGDMPPGSWELIHADRSKVFYGAPETRVVFEGNVSFANGEDRYRGDRVVYRESNGLISMEGNVLVRREGYEMQADTLFYDTKSGAAELEGEVRVTSETINVSSRKALIRGDGEMRFTGDVVFESSPYVGLADSMTVNGPQDSVLLEGVPYLSMEGGYIGGDRMVITLEEGARITSLVITGHGDLLWTGEEKTIHLQSHSLSLFFGGENRLDLILARRDVRGALETSESMNHFHGESMDVRFIGTEPEEILLTGEAGGSVTGLAAGGKEENHDGE